MRKSSALIFIWIAMLLTVGRASEFDTANQLFDQGKFGEAKQVYQMLVHRGEWSANLFYNLGNADYRIGAPGKAVLNFERALALDGTHLEARANLKWLREQTGARLPEKRWWDWLFPALPGGAFAIAAALAGWVAVFAVVPLFGRRAWGWFAFSALLVAYSIAGAIRCDKDRALAIVTAKDATARLAPADRASLAEPLTPGSRVWVLSERGEWIYCALPGGGRGWIPSSQIEKVSLTKS